MLFITRHICFVLSVVFLLASSANAIEVTLATGVNTDPPYVYGDREISSEYPGITIDILKLIESKTDIKFNIKKMPWARVVREVKDNQLDGGFHFSYKEKRKSFVAYPIKTGATVPDPKFSISNRSYVLYRLKGQSVRWNGETIVTDTQKTMRIGAMRGGSITDDLKKLSVVVNEVNTDQQLLDLLLLKRVEAFVGLENMIDAKINANTTEIKSSIEKTMPAVVNKAYYIAFSKKFYQEHPQEAWKIWEIIHNIKQSGELADIFASYSKI